MRTFGRLLCVAGLVGLLAPAFPAEGAKVRFTLGTTMSDKDFGGAAVVRWAKAMRSASKGELTMLTVTGGALGGDKQLLEQLAANEIQAHVAGPVVVHHLVREYQCMEAEYVYEDEAHGMRVWTGPLGQEVNQKLIKQYNVRILGVASRGARELTSNKPIQKPSDLQGVKVRVTNRLRAEVFKAFGALPGPLSFPELYGALRTGVYDAQENPIPTIFGAKFYEVQKYINLTGHIWSYNVVSVNNRFYESLSPAHRKIFDETFKREVVDWLNKTVPAKSVDLLKQMQKERGVQVIRPDQAAFRKIAEPVVKKFAGEKCRPGILADIAKYAKP